MSLRPAEPTLDDILDEFTLELERDDAALARFLGRYPQHADALVDLSRELSRVVLDDERPPTPDELALADASWARLRGDMPAFQADPLADGSPARLREVARSLDIPRQVVTAFRERRVVLDTVPRRFLDRLAAALGAGTEVLLASLARGPTVAAARSYRANERPATVEPVPFARVLTDAGVEPERVAALVADGE